MRIYLFRFFVMLLIASFPFLQAACSGEGGFGGAAKKESSSDEDEEDEETTASQPVQVAGAFLTCAEVTGGQIPLRVNFSLATKWTPAVQA